VAEPGASSHDVLRLIRLNPYLRHTDYLRHPDSGQVTLDPGPLTRPGQERRVRVSGNFQSWRALLRHQTGLGSHLDALLNPLFHELQRRCPNLFSTTGPPVPISDWQVEPLREAVYATAWTTGARAPLTGGPPTEVPLPLQLWQSYRDDVDPVHSYHTFYAVMDEGTARQHLRHSWDAALVESTRYVNQADRHLLWPEQLVKHPTTHAYLRRLTREIEHVYRGLLEAHENDETAPKVRKEEARGVLPLSKETRLYYTGRQPIIDHYLALRSEPKAQRFLVRQLAIAMGQLLTT